MKIRTISGILLASIIAFSFYSCKNNESPAKKIIGNYTGSFAGNWNGNDTLVESPGFTVKITELSDNKVFVEGSLFTDFEVLITNSGINVEPVANDPNLPQFLYSGDTDELDFQYNEGTNTATFNGIKS